jgi:hypothetical protein
VPAPRERAALVEEGPDPPQPVRDIQDLNVLGAAARDADAVVHLAFRHEVAFREGDPEAAVASDRAAIDVFGEALAGSDRPLAIASGVAGLRPGALATESDRPEPGPGVTMRAIAEAIGEGLGIAVGSIAGGQAAVHFGFLGAFVGIDGPVSSAITREMLDWRPGGPGLIEDIAAGHYFRERALKY